uniref:Uncharacterized protein n=1 Tax=Terrapene triunguis TaxID=2587831 RepID=A0A674JNZ1_9SAUR
SQSQSKRKLQVGWPASVLLLLWHWVCVFDCPLSSVPFAESPPERAGQRRSMPSGVMEKNPSMEPTATTPFRVTVNVSPDLHSMFMHFPPGQIGRGPGGFSPSSAAWGMGHLLEDSLHLEVFKPQFEDFNNSVIGQGFVPGMGG